MADHHVVERDKVFHSFSGNCNLYSSLFCFLQLDLNLKDCNTNIFSKIGVTF